MRKCQSQLRGNGKVVREKAATKTDFANAAGLDWFGLVWSWIGLEWFGKKAATMHCNALHCNDADGQ